LYESPSINNIINIVIMAALCRLVRTNERGQTSRKSGPEEGIFVLPFLHVRSFQAVRRRSTTFLSMSNGSIKGGIKAKTTACRADDPRPFLARTLGALTVIKGKGKMKTSSSGYDHRQPDSDGFYSKSQIRTGAGFSVNFICTRAALLLIKKRKKPK
jgi:hypothetical protein